MASGCETHTLSSQPQPSNAAVLVLTWRRPGLCFGCAVTDGSQTSAGVDAGSTHTAAVAAGEGTACWGAAVVEICISCKDVCQMWAIWGHGRCQ